MRAWPGWLLVLGLIAGVGQAASSELRPRHCTLYLLDFSAMTSGLSDEQAGRIRQEVSAGLRAKNFFPAFTSHQEFFKERSKRSRLFLSVEHRHVQYSFWSLQGFLRFSIGLPEHDLSVSLKEALPRTFRSLPYIPRSTIGLRPQRSELVHFSTHTSQLDLDAAVQIVLRRLPTCISPKLQSVL